MERTLCQTIADIVQRAGGHSRLKLRAQIEPEPWGHWLIAPALGYLEAVWCGPWPWDEIEWVEVEPAIDGPGWLAAALHKRGTTDRGSRRCCPSGLRRRARGHLP